MALIPVPNPAAGAPSLQPRERRITLFSLSGATTVDTDAQTFLVFTAEHALQCELAHLDYLYINPQALVGINVQQPSAPPPQVQMLAPSNGVAKDEEVAAAAVETRATPEE